MPKTHSHHGWIICEEKEEEEEEEEEEVEKEEGGRGGGGGISKVRRQRARGLIWVKVDEFALSSMKSHGPRK